MVPIELNALNEQYLIATGWTSLRVEGSPFRAAWSRPYWKWIPWFLDVLLYINEPVHSSGLPDVAQHAYESARTAVGRGRGISTVFVFGRGDGIVSIPAPDRRTRTRVVPAVWNGNALVLPEKRDRMGALRSDYEFARQVFFCSPAPSRFSASEIVILYTLIVLATLVFSLQVTWLLNH